MADSDADRAVFSCPRFSVYEGERKNGGGVQRVWYVRKADWVRVGVIDRQRRLAVLHERDPASGRVRLRLPGGGIDEGEDPSVAGRRELLEETGLICDDGISLLYREQPPAPWIQQSGYVYWGRVTRAERPTGPPEEMHNIEMLWLDHTALAEIVEDGDIDGYTERAFRRLLRVAGAGTRNA